MKKEGERLLTAIDLATHSAVTLLLAYYFWKAAGGWLWPLLAVAGGVLIDVDHFWDYFRYYGLKFSFADFFDHRYRASGKSYVFFHSIEIAALMWLFSAKFRVIVPLASGFTAHLVVDYLYNRRWNPLYLFLLYRWSRNFEITK